MSSSDPGRPIIRVLMFMSALALGGCFQPMYGEAAHPGLAADMRAITISPIKDRIGHYLETNLVVDLNGTGATPASKYRLTIIVSEGTLTPTVESQIGAADAATVSATATYTLTSLADQKTVASGVASSIAVYDRTIQRFGNLRAARDAELRLAKSLADEIELRIGAAISKQT
jgi:LPS-assembly lipoprotein